MTTPHIRLKKFSRFFPKKKAIIPFSQQRLDLKVFPKFKPKKAFLGTYPNIARKPI